MKIGQRVTDRETGKRGEVVHVYSHRVSVRFTDGTVKTLLQNKCNGANAHKFAAGDPVWVKISGVSRCYAGRMVGPRKAVIVEEDALWRGCVVSRKDGKFIPRKEAA